MICDHKQRLSYYVRFRMDRLPRYFIKSTVYYSKHNVPPRIHALITDAAKDLSLRLCPDRWRIWNDLLFLFTIPLSFNVV